MLLAVFVWAYVSSTQYPEKTLLPFDLTLPDPVANKGLEVVPLADQPNTVRITVSGPAELVDTVTYSQLKPYLDLSGFNQAGTYNADIKLRQGSLPENINLKIDPKTAPIRLENRTSKTLKIETVSQGDVNPDYVLDDSIQATPNEITITGRQSLVDSVTKARVAVPVTGRVGNLQATLPVQLLDSNGQIILDDKLNLNPLQVNVSANINYKLATRTVPIKVVTKGEPASGYIAGTAQTEPILETIASGNLELLNGIAFIETEPFDIGGAATEISGIVKLVPPANVTVQGSDNVLVKVGIVPFQTSKTVAVPIQVINQAANLRYVFDPKTVNLTLSGPYQAFQPELPLDKIKAIIDVQGRSFGNFSLPVQVELPPDLVVTGIPNVSVTISRPPTPVVVQPLPTRTPVPTPTFTPTPNLPTLTPIPTVASTVTPTTSLESPTVAISVTITVSSPVVSATVAPPTVAPRIVLPAPTPTSTVLIVPTTIPAPVTTPTPALGIVAPPRPSATAIATATVTPKRITPTVAPSLRVLPVLPPPPGLTPSPTQRRVVLPTITSVRP